MDTAKVIKRQLSYCLRATDTDAQRAQVQWWIDKVVGLEGDQPSADDQPAPDSPATAAAVQAAEAA